MKTLEIPNQTTPRTLEEFLRWESEDGFKYEWNDGELIKFTGMRKTEYYIFILLSELFTKKGYQAQGGLISEPDVMLTGIQMRRPDIAYFTKEQIQEGRQGEDVIPEFVIKVV